MIQLTNLSCSYDKQIVLDNISLTISKHLTILGANGSGKSTLAKAISKLIPSKGNITIDEIEIKDISSLQRAKLLSYIPPKLDIYDRYITLKEFVLLGRFPYKKRFLEYTNRDKEIVQEQLLFLHIQHLAEHTMDSLSSGETQLALIAQALTGESKIIILDEPTANLDPKNSKIIAQHIRELQKDHQIILITHDIALASFVNTPVAFIKEHTLHYFEKDFFQQNNLQRLYEVNFNGLVLAYD